MPNVRYILLSELGVPFGTATMSKEMSVKMNIKDGVITYNHIYKEINNNVKYSGKD